NGSDIVEAAKNLARTYLANIKLSRNIKVRSLPHLGSYFWFFPTKIAKLYNEEIVRPEPIVSSHTEPSRRWTMLITTKLPDV
ncbi:9227_t:CDS:2, partial [Scutellospora calospora]